MIILHLQRVQYIINIYVQALILIMDRYRDSITARGLCSGVHLENSLRGGQKHIGRHLGGGVGGGGGYV